VASPDVEFQDSGPKVQNYDFKGFGLNEKEFEAGSKRYT
jgi:hypothetical protein